MPKADAETFKADQAQRPVAVCECNARKVLHVHTPDGTEAVADGDVIEPVAGGWYAIRRGKV